MWNDSRIQALNPTVTMPAVPIVLVVHQQRSGTTLLFTSALSSMDARFKASIGASELPAWPTTSNRIVTTQRAGQIAHVLTTPGAITWLVMSDATSNSLSIARISNLADQFVLPTASAVEFTMYEKGVTITDDKFTASLNDPLNNFAYPIVGFTHLLLRLNTSLAHTDPATGERVDCAARAEVVRFWKWFYTSSSVATVAESLGFSPLPPLLVTRAVDVLTNKVLCNGEHVDPLAVQNVHLAVPRLFSTFLHLLRNSITSVSEGEVAIHGSFDSAALINNNTVNSSAAAAANVTVSTQAASVVPVHLENARQLGIDFGATTSVVFSHAAVVVTVNLNATRVPDEPAHSHNLMVRSRSGASTDSHQSELAGTSTVALSLPVLADIMMGHVTRWDDPKIVTLNPHLIMPNTTILVILPRAKSSHTLTLSKALAAHSSAFAAAVGVTRDPTKFTVTPHRRVETENEAQALTQLLPNAIAYSLWTVVTTITKTTSIAALRNAAGHDVSPSIDTMMSCLRATEVATCGTESLASRADLTGCYPLTVPVCAEVQTAAVGSQQCARAQTSVAFLSELLTNGRTQMKVIGEQQHFAPAQRMDADGEVLIDALREVTCDGVSILRPPGPRLNIVRVSRSVRTAMLVVMAVCMAIIIGMLALTYVERNHELIRASTVAANVTSMIGALVTLSAIGVAVVPAEYMWACTGVQFVLSMGFWLMVSPLIMKTWRLHKLFSMVNLRLRIMNNLKLLVVSMLIIIVELMLQVIMLGIFGRPEADLHLSAPYEDTSSAAAPASSSQSTASSSSNRLVVDGIYACHAPGGRTYYSILLAPKVIGLIVCVRMAWLVRNVKAAFNESRNIGYAVYMVCLMSVIALPLYIMLHDNVNAAFFILSMGVVFCTMSLTAAIVGSKFWAIFVSKSWKPRRRSKARSRSRHRSSDDSSRATPGNSPRVAPRSGANTPRSSHADSKAMESSYRSASNLRLQRANTAGSMRSGRFGGVRPANAFSARFGKHSVIVRPRARGALTMTNKEVIDRALSSMRSPSVSRQHSPASRSAVHNGRSSIPDLDRAISMPTVLGVGDQKEQQQQQQQQQRQQQQLRHGSRVQPFLEMASIDGDDDAHAQDGNREDSNNSKNNSDNGDDNVGHRRQLSLSRSQSVTPISTRLSAVGPMMALSSHATVSHHSGQPPPISCLATSSSMSALKAIDKSGMQKF
eukprot:TRINITY_DN66979_c8_g10_i1.p1 TRINITY_DN66979_c8_g10~~TRINITY_DN66979_c8_g10_i1.p1  ORF type:complete len:1313 (+),score=459.48 TRINITY_DN66979_c8_g10_i1:330-3941(+)